MSDKRTVLDMSKLTHNERFQLKCMIADYGAGYMIDAIKHIEYLFKLKEETK